MKMCIPGIASEYDFVETKTIGGRSVSFYNLFGNSWSGPMSVLKPSEWNAYEEDIFITGHLYDGLTVRGGCCSKKYWTDNKRNGNFFQGK